MVLFPSPRRIVTGHNKVGKAVVVSDTTIAPKKTPVDCEFAVLYETHQFPASNDEWNDPIVVRTKSLANEKGVVMRVVNFPPKTKTAKLIQEMRQIFHRTLSLDFGILHIGEMTCHLEDDARIEMKAGDVCVQRGTIHGWTNYSDKPARVYFILTAASPVKIGDKTLGNEGFRREDVESGGL